MSAFGQPERATQNRIIALFRNEMGYRYLGDWTDREGNSNIEEDLLSAWLKKGGYTTAQIATAIHSLRTEADNHNRNLYGNNQALYSLLRYGIPVKVEAGKVTENVHLVNWHEPEKNDFAIVEEVTLKGNHERRPDIALYVNGIAIGVVELKNSRVTIGETTTPTGHRRPPPPGSFLISTFVIEADRNQVCWNHFSALCRWSIEVNGQIFHWMHCLHAESTVDQLPIPYFLVEVLFVSSFKSFCFPS